MVDEYAEPGVEDETGGVDGEASEPHDDGSEATTWEPAPIAGRYRVGAYVGTSRLGRTYRAWDSETAQDVEVTFLDADAVAAATGVEERLEQLRALGHLHVLPLLDWEIAPVPYLVYAAPEMRLDRLIAAGAPLSPSQTLLIGLQAADTLHSLRRQGITHGALGPAHCCVDASGRIQLAEMGVEFLRAPRGPADATPYDAPETLGGDDRPHPEPQAPAPADAGAGEDADAEDAAPGSPADVEPEPSRSEAAVAAGAAADVYGLGLSLTEAAAGRPVAPAEISRLGRAVAPAGIGAAAARHLARLAPPLVQATAPRPEQRLEADELALALRATAEMLPPPARLDEVLARAGDPVESEEGEEPAAVPQPLRGNWRDSVMRIAAAAAVVIAGAFLVFHTAGGEGTPSHTVPDVVGMSWPQANDTLTASGWEVRRLEVRVPDAAAGDVVGQLPEAGGLLDEGQVVKVQVSLGAPLVIVPADIVGIPLEEAGLRLSSVGLAVGNVETRVDSTVPHGSVVAIAEALPELPRGSQVDLVIAVAR